jgi:class 3 adenylate cyclase
MPELPSGTVTVLFTDIDGRSVLWERDRNAMAVVIGRHIAPIGAAIQVHGGVFSTRPWGMPSSQASPPRIRNRIGS